MKCKRPEHGLTPFRVVWPTACRFTQHPYGKYNIEGEICQISPSMFYSRPSGSGAMMVLYRRRKKVSVRTREKTSAMG